MLGFSSCLYYQGVRNSKVSTRRDLTVPGKNIGERGTCKYSVHQYRSLSGVVRGTAISQDVIVFNTFLLLFCFDL